MGKHQKHTKLIRPASGFYARNEWGLVGTNCGLIKRVAKQLVSELGQWYKISYMDADHKAGDDEPSNYYLEYEDKIKYHRFNIGREMNEFDFKQQFIDSDIHLINGNHFKSKKQIVFVDELKEKSLLKRLDQLTDIRAIVLKDTIDIYGFLKEKIEDRNIPILKIEQIGQLSSIMETNLADANTKIKALVLAGGKSQRMGQDKSQIQYFGKPQTIHLYDLLKTYIDDVFVSTTPKATDDWDLPVLPDTFTGLGPYGAILSAFREDPNSAWLVIACDLPFVEGATIEKLLMERDPSKYATAFHNVETNFPDPLITLWEPKAYSRLFQFLAQGYSCPRKVLINSDIKSIEALGSWLRNVNSPEELELAKSEIQKSRLN
jgi:molybdopterin-guanine dinucleotide biosynthesis protein A